MALIVKIFVNEHQILETHVVRIKGQPHKPCIYQCPDGSVIRHHYDDGAAKLAIKMLKKVTA